MIGSDRKCTGEMIFKLFFKGGNIFQYQVTGYPYGSAYPTEHPSGIANIPVGTLEIPEHLKCQSL